MITSPGFALIAELVAAAFLIVALTGFTVRRSRPWLMGTAMAFVALIVAVTIVIEASS
jgi:hypothetical protein